MLLIALTVLAQMVTPDLDTVKMAERMKQKEWLNQQSADPRTQALFGRHEMFAIPARNRNATLPAPTGTP